MNRCERCPYGSEMCPRCATRFCMEHAMLPGEACNPCELAYHESKSTLKMNLWFVVGFALPWVVFVGILDRLPAWSARSGGIRAITTGIPMLDAIIMFSVMAIIAGKGAMGLRHAFHRNAFMRPVYARRQ